MAYVLALMMMRNCHFGQFIGLLLRVMFQSATAYYLTIVSDGKKNLSAFFHYIVNMRESLNIRGFNLEV